MVFKNLEELQVLLKKNGYSKRKSDIYISSYEQGINIYPYLNHDVKTGRLREIMLGLKNKVDVSIYDNYMVYHQAQMKEIRFGLMNGVDVSIYAKPEFSAEQMVVIRLGLERGIDVKDYADPHLTAPQMWQFFYRLIAVAQKGEEKCTAPNFGRFNLEQFKFQRVDFEGTITNCNIISPYMYSLVIQNLFWQGEYICDHIWVSCTVKTDKHIVKEDTKFQFGDRIAFSAEVEPYLHNKDGNVHYGLCKIKDIEVLEQAEYINNYKLNHMLFYNVDNILYFNKAEQKEIPGKEPFLNLHELDSNTVKIGFELIGYKRDKLMFTIWADNQKLEDCYGYYNPYKSKIRLYIGNFFFEDTAVKTRRAKRLMNTFFQAKYLQMLPIIKALQWKVEEV